MESGVADSRVRFRVASPVVRTLVGIAIIGLPVLGWTDQALATCYGPACTVTGGGSSGGSGSSGSGSGSGNGGNYTPIYPPPEPLCVDQGGYIRPYSINSNLTINGQTYDDEFVNCSSTGAASQAAQRDNGSLAVDTQSPNNPNPSGNPSCGALSWWVDANTAYANHRSNIPGAQYWGARAGVGMYTPNEPKGHIGPNRFTPTEIATFCQVWFLVPYLNRTTAQSSGYSWHFNVSTDLPPTLPSPQWGSYGLPDLSSKNPGGVQNIYPPYQQDATVDPQGQVLPPVASPFGPVALTNTPYAMDPQIPTQQLTGTVQTSAPILINNGQQVGTVTLTMHYYAVPMGVQIFNPPNTLPPQPLLGGTVLGYNSLCSMPALSNSAQGFHDAAYDFENNTMIPNYLDLAPTSSLCEVQFNLPSVTTQNPHNAWPLTARGKWDVTYTSATFQASFDPSPFRTNTGQVIALPSSSTGTITPGSAKWPSNPSGYYYGLPSTTTVRVAAAESVPILGGS